jgi:hypothetical protein
MVMIVLLKDAWICAIPSATFFLIFLRARTPFFVSCDCVAMLFGPCLYLVVVVGARVA